MPVILASSILSTEFTESVKFDKFLTFPLLTVIVLTCEDFI